MTTEKTTILRPGRNCWTLGKVESGGALINGRDYYKAIFDAAAKAENTILMAGWAFDSDVRLLRGKDAQDSREDVRLLPYLNHLCEKNPKLRVYILAWDFLEFLAFEREWGQSRLFNQSPSGRIKFRFDNRHCIFGSHHQKMVIVDGHLGFVGGLDLCRGRWDDRRHRYCHPFHDVQSFIAGPAVGRLVKLFKRGWTRAGGGTLVLPPAPKIQPVEFRGSAPLCSSTVAVSRTQARTLFPPQRPIYEIRQLYVDAIRSAEKFIYIENQYFASRAVFRALLERLIDPQRSRLQIVLILPQNFKTVIEDLALGVTQRRMLRILQRTASRRGHQMGIFYSMGKGSNGKETPTVIHSKLLLVDDRFLTLGSANTINRSMGLDTELNLAWEATEGNIALEKSLCRLRLDLLSEHTGFPLEQTEACFADPRQLVFLLSRLADSRTAPLRRHELATRFHWLPSLGLKQMLLDPESPIIEERLHRLARSLKFFLPERLFSTYRWQK